MLRNLNCAIYVISNFIFKRYLNNQQYPYLNLDIDAEQHQFSVAYEMYLKFQFSYYGKSTEPLLSRTAWFQKYRIIVIDCSHQNELLKTGPVEVRVEFELRENVPERTAAYCLLLHDKLFEYTPLSSLVTKIT